jgi:glycine/D-amino acid oxidase-like deaminating enzyme
MRQGYDVVVVGSGVVGAAAAASLAGAGLSVAVVTGGRRAAGAATVASGGLVRCYEPDADRRALALRSHQLLWGRPERRREATGHTVTGSLVCLTTEEADKADAVLDEFADHGVRAELLGPEEIARRWPALGTERIVAGLWEPTGGYADPPRTAAMFLAEARRAGATVLDGEALTTLVAGDRVTGVATTVGDVSASAVVLAAGCATPRLLPPGVGPAMRTRRIRYALVGWPDRSVPTVMDHVTGMWGRPYGDDALLVGRPVDEWDVSPKAGTDITPDQLAYIREGARPRWPDVSRAPLVGARWGTDLYPPTGPLLGPVESHPGLILAAGWSGAGFKTAPAAAEAVLHAVREL